MRQLFDAARPLRADRRDRAHPGRDRHRQGARRRRDPPALAAPRRAVRRARLRARSRERCSRASCSATSAARSPAPSTRTPACSRRRTAARCSSTRSASCRSTSSPSCCARSRRARSAASAAPKLDRVDVRIVAATNRDLAAEVNRGTLPRGPLLPPRGRRRSRCRALRERREDIPLLVEHFLASSARRATRPAPRPTTSSRAREAPRVAGQRPRAAQRGRARRAPARTIRRLGFEAPPKKDGDVRRRRHRRPVQGGQAEARRRVRPPLPRGPARGARRQHLGRGARRRHRAHVDLQDDPPASASTRSRRTRTARRPPTRTAKKARPATRAERDVPCIAFSARRGGDDEEAPLRVDRAGNGRRSRRKRCAGEPASCSTTRTFT